MASPAMPIDVDAATGKLVTAARPAAWLIALRGFADGAMGASIIVAALMGIELSLGVPRLLGAVVMGFLGFAFVSAGEGLTILTWKLLRRVLGLLRFGRGVAFLDTVPPVPVGRIIGAFIFAAGDVLWPESFLKNVALPVAGEIGIALAGLTVMLVALARMEGRSRRAQWVLVGVPAALIVAFAIWLIDPGFDEYVAAAPDAATTALSLENPGLAGPYAVQQLNYGSGSSKRRTAFGEGAALLTPTVDGTALFPGYGGMVDAYFRWYWGFGFDALPLNGTVWYPEGEGPFPLVLMVHGNHAMSEPSDPGYAYLGEHLASQGYIAVSVDENFLNGLLFFDGEFEELPLRAWLLLQHLAQWQAWNETPGNPVTGKVDMERIALLGHSRGGEAVAWAAEMNWEPAARVSGAAPASDKPFGIRGVVAVAPSDAYSGTGGRKPKLAHTDYMLLAGGHDADTYLLYGQTQYNRTRFAENPEGFKALAYVYQGNHGQFNTVWGDEDRGLYNSLLLNRQPLLSAEAQQESAKTLISSFLAAALRDEADYRDVFRNPGATAGWLPEGLVITQYQDAQLIPVDTNNGSNNIASVEAQGGTAKVQDTESAGVEALRLRDGKTMQDNRAVRLTWQADNAPVYEVVLDEKEVAKWGLGAEDALTFALAAVPGATPPQDVVIELETADGTRAGVALSDFGGVVPPLPAKLVKAAWLQGLNGFPGETRPEEVVLQTYSLPLTAFEAGDTTIEPEMLRTVRFRFDGAEAGGVYLDTVGFSMVTPAN